MLSKIELYVIDKVRELRLQKNISQTDLANKIGISQAFIGKVESFKYHAKYNLNHLNNIAKALDISPKELLPEQSL